MRTTITLEQDVAERAKAAVAKLGRPFKQVVNEALRIGLDHLQRPPKPRPYHTKAPALRLRQRVNLDNIQELLPQVEGEDA